MRGDFARLTFDPTKHYTGVLHQQGRVWLEADWNEHVFDRQNLLRQETFDIIGACGVPEPGTAFQNSPNPDPASQPFDFLISGGPGAQGRYYVDGILCELEATPFTPVGFPGASSMQVPAWIVDGHEFQVGQWIEISGIVQENRKTQLVQISAVDPVNRILTFSADVSAFQQATAPSAKRQTTYLSQPDFPDAPNIQMPSVGSDLRALVYLEVWQRLITYLEDDALREIALGGPDTATRLKTVAQVKVLPVSSDVAQDLTCATSDQFFPGPGQGTLTTLQPTNSQPADLCSLPDPSLYTGRENHLYRVEIHNGGDVIGSNAGFAFTQPLAQDADAEATTLIIQQILSSDQLNALSRSGVVSLMDSDGQTEIATVTDATTDSSTSTTRLTLDQGLSRSFTVANNATVTGGVARFKWSRDNASFALRVVAVSADRRTLTLSSLGRDTATALRQLDLVEMSDDASELGPARGHLTYLAADPDPDLFTVVIADPLPDNFQLERHLVLRRWDGWGWARAVFDTASTPDMNLGDGIHIQFGGQDLRSGDFWQFAARSADGSVEILNAAPPMGIIRHVCPLAVVDWSFLFLFDSVDIFQASQEVQLSNDQLTQLVNKMNNSGKSLWKASEVHALFQSVGATQEQLSLLDNFLASLIKDQKVKARLIFTVLEDCRQPFGPLTKRCCDCTVTVAPGESLSAAFDKISGVGGTVCLLPGVYELTDTVLVSAKNGLTIRGAGAATIVSASNLAVAFRFVNCANLTLRDLAIRSIQPVVGLSQPPGSETPARGAQPIPTSGPVRPDGVVTFTDCQAVHVTGCIVACAALPNGPYSCISFLSPAQNAMTNLLSQAQQQARPDPGSDTSPEDPQATSDSSGTKDEGKKKARRKGQQAQDAGSTQAPSPTTEAKSATSGVSDAVSPVVSLSSVINAQERSGINLDFTLRDCRLYADTGQFGLLVTNSIGASIEDNWFFPLANLDPIGLETVLTSIDPSQRADTALTFEQCLVLSVTNNLVLGFNSVLSATAGDLLLCDNVADSCGYGFNIFPFTSLRITHNVLSTDTGPAVSIDAGSDLRFNSDEVFLSGNDLLRLETPQGVSQAPTQVVSISAGTATLADNNFRNQKASLDSSVTVTANRITYTSNRSVCESNTIPTANVILLGPIVNGQVTGSITAVSNTCLEPQTLQGADFKGTLEEFQRQQAALVSKFMATQVQAERQQLLQQLSTLSNREQEFAPRLKEIVASGGGGGSSSLFVSAAFSVTGMNLLSNSLVRMGIGSDQGSQDGVF